MIHEDRKISEGWEDPTQLLAHPDNPKIHPMGQTAAVKAAIRELGWMAKIKVNTRTGYVIDGHDRIKAMMQEGVEQVPVEYYDLSPEEEKLFLVTYDPIGTMFASDRELTAKLLNDVNTGEEALQQFLSDQAEELGIVDYDSKAESLDAEPQISRADELREEWGVELGQVWRLPSRMEGQEHLIACGDCTEGGVVDSVMMGEKADMMVTDPPYGVEYDPNWRVEAGHNERTHGDKIQNDHIASWENAYSHFGGDVAYIWHASWMTHIVANDLSKLGYDVEKGYVIVWNKDLAVFGRGDYHWKHELCRYVWKMGKPHGYTGDQKQTTVWDIPTIHSFANGKNKEEWGIVGHATQKPIECMERPIRHHEGMRIIYEPFSGSGTTLIACENLSRQCRAVEISPAYVAVALQRYKDAFGITAELVKK